MHNDTVKRGICEGNLVFIYTDKEKEFVAREVLVSDAPG
jgi:hypothetical protein